MAKGITTDTWINDTPRQFLGDGQWVEISFAEQNPSVDHMPRESGRIRSLYWSQKWGNGEPTTGGRDREEVTYHLFLALASKAP